MRVKYSKLSDPLAASECFPPEAKTDRGITLAELRELVLREALKGYTAAYFTNVRHAEIVTVHSALTREQVYNCML